MPTTKGEAEKISTIINEYLGPKVAQELTGRLACEVGKTSSNDSLKESLSMLASLYNVELTCSKLSNPLEVEIKNCTGLHHDD